MVRAEELGDILLPAFDTPTGIPYQTLNLQTRIARNPSWTQRSSILSELGTEQVKICPAPKPCCSMLRVPATRVVPVLRPAASDCEQHTGSAHAMPCHAASVLLIEISKLRTADSTTDIVPIYSRPQLEFISLSDKTGRAVFAEKVEGVVKTLHERFTGQVSPRACGCTTHANARMCLGRVEYTATA